MRTKLSGWVGSGLVISLVLVVGLVVTLRAGASREARIEGDRVAICHLQEKVDPDLEFNDGRVIEINKAACRAHCAHGDHPMPVPLDNDAHPNRLCARIHVTEGLPSCEVNTPLTDDGEVCSVDACIARCNAS